MRLVTFEANGARRVGVERKDGIVDLKAVDRGLPGDMRSLLDGGSVALDRAQSAADLATSAAVLPKDSVKLRAPISDPRKIVCIGLNYLDHAKESGAAVPPEPIMFSKYPTAIVGPGDNIEVPSVSKETDYECELVVVIGKRGRHIKKGNAYEHVAGYTCGNDVSARDYQLKKAGGQWMIGKTFDTFAPIGPAIVTTDEIPDPQTLGIRTVVNGETLQNSSTAQLIFNVPTLVEYISHVITLEPGDLIFTGTPPGVGFARKPPRFLMPGDWVEIQIDGIGNLRNPCVAG